MVDYVGTVSVGSVLKGFCNGFFGRDSYEDKMIEAMGMDWVVVREIDSKEPLIATFHDGWQKEDMWKLLYEWSTSDE